MAITDRIALTLLNQWQRGFPLCDEPFAEIGKTLAMSGDQVLDRYQRLKNSGALSRIGGVFAPGAGGASMLAAMAVPPHALEHVATIVSAQPGVNHNYEREHRINLWFVVTGSDLLALEQQLQAIETAAGIAVLRLPMLRAFRIDTAFDMEVTHAQQHSGATHCAPCAIARSDEPLAALVEHGLDFCNRPYERWAHRLGSTSADVQNRLSEWTRTGVLSRFGVVVRHHEVGFRANAMAVFEVPEDLLNTCGNALAQVPGVTLVYQRAIGAQWPFNLYCMVHGRDRIQVQQTLLRAAQHAMLDSFPSRVLFSLTRFKQTGARRFAHHIQEPEHA